MNPYYEQGGITIYHSDCRDVAPELNGIDTVITDPPYGLGFMGKDWDAGVPGVHFWQLIRAACKPGAMCLSFGGTRTFHRLTCAIEDAGFEVHDCLMWLYGTGFPKSLDISKAIDKAAGKEREVVGIKEYAGRIWNGYGTALKPAWEPIILSMNPLDGTFANNALTHGVAGLNVDGGRVDGIKGVPASLSNKGQHGWKTGGDMEHKRKQQGRFPANVIHDGSDEVVGMFPNTTSATSRTDTVSAGMFAGGDAGTVYPDTGSAARFFYCAKASRAERCDGLNDRDPEPAGKLRGRNDGSLHGDTHSTNTHPTVKPLALMQYLCRLTKTPTGGIIFDPFAGSGSTLIAAQAEGRPAIGIEIDERYCEIAAARLQKAVERGIQTYLFDPGDS